MNQIMLEPLSVPLHRDDFGVIRIINSRIPIDTVVTAFKLGSTPETICDDYPTLDLVTVYAVLAFYLAHRSEIDEYMQVRTEIAEEIRRECVEQYDQVMIRERLLARKAAREANK